ncbi:MAG TPA: hypothetical protein VMG82_28465 [Candidatus Sulfotelmatobacter sp.]|nr:hypothetical protein [Candidatus Sulfotelmatobacter sp.]
MKADRIHASERRLKQYKGHVHGEESFVEDLGVLAPPLARSFINCGLQR